MKVEISYDAEELRDGADACVVVRGDDDRGVASCSVWNGGSLGHFSAESGAAAGALLEAAEEVLRQAGCEKVYGPMDGNTWRRYRLVTESDGRKPFLLEPVNPEAWPGYFVDAGWQVAAGYSSSVLALSPEVERPGLRRVIERLGEGGVRVRPLDVADYLEELRRIYAVSLVSFADNFLYSPIGWEEFVAMYQKVEPLLVPEFCLLAEDVDGTAVGFVFALPDPQLPGTVIVKSLAVLPQRRFAGLGSLLVEQVHAAARRLGFTQAIHALQHENNTSKKISSRHAAEIFRRYTLYEKHL